MFEISPQRTLRWALFTCFWVRSAARYGNYFEFDSEHPHRMPLSKKCGDFECPAFQRPVQKYEADYKIWAWTECPLEAKTAQKLDQAAMDRRASMQKDLGSCCEAKYVCMHTCGMKLQDCYKVYWECVERECYVKWKDDNQDCLHIASWNDIRHLPAHDTGELNPMPMYGENVCQAFNALQRQSCDCVPHADWEGLLQKRMEAFFHSYDSTQLSKKGKVKEKTWKAWRNKRPMMMFAYSMKFKADGAVEYRRNTSAEEVLENEELKSESGSSSSAGQVEL